ncbi:tRNA (adenosine(37)-N6)-threonylcarbamoyltransferase complex dimerization subunit type 1 TsaB [Robbsia sp. KACC 23696]|uniref:tRNA (adenosine(37)-N6)-threonylcarbamoyltransferase complex dimerization subunit type 1 TsaB n=1 Tax=Robbsia sp. KACC 23696 TaxID=3149231 RepID=UPI00325B8DE6
MNHIAAHRSAAAGSADPSSDPTGFRSASVSVGGPSARTALLVIDTSTDACAVAVCLPLPLSDTSPPVSPAVAAAADMAASEITTITIRDDIVAGARIVACWRRTGAVSSEALLPMVQAVLDAAGIALPSCGAIAFGAGPGSFTGVRTATGAAQGLAFANDMPVVPLDTLMACAESARLRAAPHVRPRRVYVAVDARMGECYAAAFGWEADGGWRVEIDAHVAPPQHLQAPPASWSAAPSNASDSATADRAAGFVLAGNAAAIFGDALPLRAQASACDEAAWPEPLALAALGWRAWHAGAAVPAAMAQPRYVRDKVALTTKERLAAKEAKSVSKEAGA